MGALWTDGEGRAGETAAAGWRGAVRQAIDLWRPRFYDAPSSRAPERRRASPRATTAASVRAGLWLREADARRRTVADRFRRWLRIILHTDDTPARAALAFALGVFVAWTPLFGLHTLLGLALAFVLGLNRVAVLTGTLINNPWTFVPIYAGSLKTGALLLGAPEATPRLLDLLAAADIGRLVVELRPWVGPLAAGTLLLGAASALLSFPVVLYGIRWYRALRHAEARRSE